jgi:hypothetical protein
LGFQGIEVVVICPRGDNGIQVNVYAPIGIAVTRSGEIAILVAGQYLACDDCSSIVDSKVGRTAV